MKLTLACSALLLLPLCATATDLFTPVAANRSSASSPEKGYSVAFNRIQAMAIKPGTEFKLNIPNGKSYTVVFEREEISSSGNHTFIGYLAEQGKTARCIITHSSDAITGRCQTPEGEVLLDTKNSQQLMIPTWQYGIRPAVPAESDIMLPEQMHPKSGMSPQAAPVAAGSDSVIDLMVYYTPGFSAAQGGNPWRRIDYLVALTNQAYQDSGIAARLRLVHTQAINYTDNSDLYAPLEAISSSTTPFQDLEGLRSYKGADLVTLIRPFTAANGGVCGLAWMPNLSQFRKEMGFSVVSDGTRPDGYYCDDTTLAHELGHNLGQNHDHEHASNGGAHSYSYGYGLNNIFGDIMSYYWPKVAKFSSPNLQCNGYVCGLSGYADTALSINQTWRTVANYLPSAQGQNTFTPESGWYWDASQPGTGYAIEIKDGKAFIGLFMYNNTGKPIWYISSGAMSSSTEFNGSLLYFRNGQPLKGSYKAPESPTVIGNASVKFSDARHATLTLPSGFTANLERFNIVAGGVENPASTISNINGWYWNASESGSGYFFESQKDNVYSVAFMYDSLGDPVWYVSTDTWAAYNGCTAAMTDGYWLKFGNGTYLGSSYRPASLVDNAVIPNNTWLDRCNNTGSIFVPGRVPETIPLSKFTF
ncbi:reprolysin-like metallopeptidase [Chitinilyticum aquatile]|uniref:reprolysin-like metallopeptidase n=1 Tax=Chitinilyticum aquatile TaxID=362520 RepID=UPI0003F5F390|nr:zinc-dependent metalloprotease family protein [Chitinilyticum aquatile]